MSVNNEYCDPFLNDGRDIWMKLEHCGRYIFAADLLAENKCRVVIDLACSNGYGSLMLAEQIPTVIAVDRNPVYLDSDYLKNSRIKCFCLDLDEAEGMDKLPVADAVVCFETIEHLKYPYVFLENIIRHIDDKGILVLSFPNEEYERFNEDGTNRDPYHLHIIDPKKVCQILEENGMKLLNAVGQPICNEMCSIQHELKKNGVLNSQHVDSAFNYDAVSIRALARLMAYPMSNRVENSYSSIYVAIKND